MLRPRAARVARKSGSGVGVFVAVAVGGIVVGVAVGGGTVGVGVSVGDGVKVGVRVGEADAVGVLVTIATNTVAGVRVGVGVLVSSLTTKTAGLWAGGSVALGADANTAPPSSYRECVVHVNTATWPNWRSEDTDIELLGRIDVRDEAAQEIAAGVICGTGLCQGQ